MSLYYEPNARITVGNVLFEQVHEVKISESVKDLGDNALITLPRNYKELNGKGVLDFIKVGDPVLIELGTGGSYYEEFKGYLSEISSDIPMILHCDDSFYPLKRNNFVKAWEKVTLKELLNYIASGYTIDAPDVNLGEFQISNVSSYRVLRSLKEQYGFYSYMRENTLHCQFAYDVRGFGDILNYKIGNNTKAGGNNLKYHRAEDVKVKVKAIANQRTGKKLVYETGSTDPQAALRTLNFGAISMAELKEIAEKTYNKLAFDGYSGSIKGFAFPRVHAGDTLRISDENEPDREGDYLVEKTVIRYGLSKGFERENTLSYKV